MQTRLEREDVYEAIKEALDIDPFLSYLILSKEEANENLYIYLDMVEDAKILYDKIFDEVVQRKIGGVNTDIL